MWSSPISPEAGPPAQRDFTRLDNQTAADDWRLFMPVEVGPRRRSAVKYFPYRWSQYFIRNVVIESNEIGRFYGKNAGSFPAPYRSSFFLFGDHEWEDVFARWRRSNCSIRSGRTVQATMATRWSSTAPMSGNSSLSTRSNTLPTMKLQSPDEKLVV